MTHMPSYLTAMPGWRWRWAGVAAVSMLSACSTLPDRGPEISQVQSVIPQQWAHADSTPSGVAPTSSAAWWTAVGDAQLNGLVQLALSQNLSLAVAARRVDQAQRRLASAESDLWPKPQGQLSYSSSQPLDGGSSTRRAQASVSVNWEIDLWGRLSAQAQTSNWDLVATEQDRMGIEQSLVASVVRAYWQWAYAQERVAVAEGNLALVRQMARLIDIQYRAGAISGLERAQALQSQATQEANLAQWQASLEETRQTLALLMGQAPSSVALPSRGRLPAGDVPVVMPGLPATVLACRPDVRAAQAHLQKAWSQQDATARQWYPAITLTGSVSGSAVSLADVLKDPLGALSSTLTMPFLQWRERERQVDIAQADADIARMTFHQVLFQALSEVDKHLVLQAQLKQQLAAQDRRLHESRTVERLTRARYDAGAEPLRVLLQAQQDMRQSELDRAQVALQAWTQWANAMLALGQGGCSG